MQRNFQTERHLWSNNHELHSIFKRQAMSVVCSHYVFLVYFPVWNTILLYYFPYYFPCFLMLNMLKTNVKLTNGSILFQVVTLNFCTTTCCKPGIQDYN